MTRRGALAAVALLWILAAGDLYLGFIAHHRGVLIFGIFAAAICLIGSTLWLNYAVRLPRNCEKITTDSGDWNE